MKYKCISSFEKDGKTIMNEGDIVIARGDELYNITTGVDYKGITFKDISENIVTVTDEPVFTSNPVSVDTTSSGERRLVSDVDMFEEITNRMLDTFKKKNHDYGNSFEQSLDEEGLVGMRIRGGDKWIRFKNLSKGKNPLVKDESIRDTLLDLANYCIMTVMWIDKQ